MTGTTTILDREFLIEEPQASKRRCAEPRQPRSGMLRYETGAQRVSGIERSAMWHRIPDFAAFA
jgi:hypothetical protein